MGRRAPPSARRARARGGRDRVEGGRARDRVRRRSASSSARRSAPTRRSRIRSSTPTSPSSSPARSPTGRPGAVAEGDDQADLAVAAAKSQAAEAAVLACEKSIQAHGGIGFTWEHPLHRYYKRALWLEGALGYGRELRAEVAASLLCLVTGASTGIGRATAELPAAARLDGVRVRAAAPVTRRPAREELVFDVTDAGGDRSGGRTRRGARRARRERRASRSPRRSSSCRPTSSRASSTSTSSASCVSCRRSCPRSRHGEGRIVIDRLDRRTVGAAVPRCLRDEQVRARGDGRRAARRACSRGGCRWRSSSRARSRRDLDEAAADGRGAAARRRRSCTASGSSGSAGSPPRARPGTPSRRTRWRRAIEHALTAAKPRAALRRRPRREEACAWFSGSRTGCATACSRGSCSDRRSRRISAWATR